MLGYELIITGVGVGVAGIISHLPSNEACFILKVATPTVVEVVNPIWIALIVAATPTLGIKSSFSSEPERYAWYVPSPGLEYAFVFVWFVNCPYSKSSTLVPLWIIFNSSISYLFSVAAIETKTFNAL